MAINTGQGSLQTAGRIAPATADLGIVGNVSSALDNLQKGYATGQGLAGGWAQAEKDAVKKRAQDLEAQALKAKYTKATIDTDIASAVATGQVQTEEQVQRLQVLKNTAAVNAETAQRQAEVARKQAELADAQVGQKLVEQPTLADARKRILGDIAEKGTAQFGETIYSLNGDGSISSRNAPRPLAGTATFTKAAPVKEPYYKEIGGERMLVQDWSDGSTRRVAGAAKTTAASTSGEPEGAYIIDPSAPAAGLPGEVPNPTFGQNPATAEKMKQDLSKRAAVRLTKVQEKAAAAEQMAKSMQVFKALNRKVRTGPMWKYAPSLSAEAQEMESIIAKAVPQMRVPGSGTTSDFDARMFERSVVGMDRSPAANAAIADGYILWAQTQGEYASFLEDYITRFGSDRGADKTWKQYLDANPIFDPNSDSPQVNQNRQTREEYFQRLFEEQGGNDSLGGEGAPEAPPTTPGAPSIPTAPSASTSSAAPLARFAAGQSLASARPAVTRRSDVLAPSTAQAQPAAQEQPLELGNPESEEAFRQAYLKQREEGGRLGEITGALGKASLAGTKQVLGDVSKYLGDTAEAAAGILSPGGITEEGKAAIRQYHEEKLARTEAEYMDKFEEAVATGDPVQIQAAKSAYEAAVGAESAALEKASTIYNLVGTPVSGEDRAIAMQGSRPRGQELAGLAVGAGQALSDIPVTAAAVLSRGLEFAAPAETAAELSLQRKRVLAGVDDAFAQATEAVGGSPESQEVGRLFGGFLVPQVPGVARATDALATAGSKVSSLGTKALRKSAAAGLKGASAASSLATDVGLIATLPKVTATLAAIPGAGALLSTAFGSFAAPSAIAGIATSRKGLLGLGKYLRAGAMAASDQIPTGAGRLLRWGTKSAGDAGEMLAKVKDRFAAIPASGKILGASAAESGDLLNDVRNGGERWLESLSKQEEVLRAQVAQQLASKQVYQSQKALADLHNLQAEIRGGEQALRYVDKLIAMPSAARAVALGGEAGDVLAHALVYGGVGGAAASALDQGSGGNVVEQGVIPGAVIGGMLHLIGKSAKVKADGQVDASLSKLKKTAATELDELANRVDELAEITPEKPVQIVPEAAGVVPDPLDQIPMSPPLQWVPGKVGNVRMKADVLAQPPAAPEITRVPGTVRNIKFKPVSNKSVLAKPRSQY